MTGSGHAFRELGSFPAGRLWVSRGAKRLGIGLMAQLEPGDFVFGLRQAGLRLRSAASGALSTGGLALLIVLALVTPMTAAAAPQDETPRRIALVIGNSNYETIPILPNPRRDASAIADSLERLGFEVRRVLDGDMRSRLKKRFISKTRHLRVPLVASSQKTLRKQQQCHRRVWDCHDRQALSRPWTIDCRSPRRDHPHRR